jgi:hypothetical protein
VDSLVFSVDLMAVAGFVGAGACRAVILGTRIFLVDMGFGWSGGIEAAALEGMKEIQLFLKRNTVLHSACFIMKQVKGPILSPPASAGPEA